MSKKTKLSLNQMMIRVIVAMVPAICFLSYWQGIGFIVNVGVGLVGAVVFELLPQNNPPPGGRGVVAGLTASLTALLLLAGIPGTAAWWVPLVGMFFAIVVAKQLFGGLGQNIFNPAMVGYAILLVSFPTEMVVWPAWSTDSMSAATPLDHAQVSVLEDAYLPWFILNGLWLLGGLVLLYKKIISWVLPGGFLLGFILTSLFFPDPVIQLGLGATMIGAFFIVTDPVTAPASPKMRFIYAFMIGCLVILMRQYSHYPDGLAFAILLGNACAPIMDQISQRKHA